MYLLRIEHAVADFGGWKKAFDNDPIDRQQSGVRRHRVLRAIDDPNYVGIDLEFDSANAAEAFHAALRDLWSRVDVIRDPQARIAETLESRDY